MAGESSTLNKRSILIYSTRGIALGVDLRILLKTHPWIRFGPHALDSTTPPHTQTLAAQQEFCESFYNHIHRFAGRELASRWVRLHYFSDCCELATFFRSRQVDALLTTDKPALRYRLPVSQNEQLARQSDTEFASNHFVRSHVRLTQRDHETWWNTTVKRTERLVSALQTFAPDCYFKYLSTACVFQGDGGNYSEFGVPNPKNSYGQSKLIGEYVASRMAHHLVVRTTLVAREPWPFLKAFVDRFEITCLRTTWPLCSSNSSTKTWRGWYTWLEKRVCPCSSWQSCLRRMSVRCTWQTSTCR